MLYTKQSLDASNDLPQNWSCVYLVMKIVRGKRWRDGVGVGGGGEKGRQLQQMTTTKNQPKT